MWDGIGSDFRAFLDKPFLFFLFFAFVSSLFSSMRAARQFSALTPRSSTTLHDLSPSLTQLSLPANSHPPSLSLGFGFSYTPQPHLEHRTWPHFWHSVAFQPLYLYPH